MPEASACPRLVIAGLAGDSGKTLVALALAKALTRRGLVVQPYKKGPDYIDAAWLGWASGRQARNLDTFMCGRAPVRSLFVRTCIRHGLNLIEGNRGLFDGLDPAGSHSTAALARLLEAPVVLVLDARKATATVGAIAEGIRRVARGVRVEGVVLNRVGGPRHRTVCTESVLKRSRLRVLGAIPRLGDSMPDRHLGLVPVHESRDLAAVEQLLDEAASHLDVDGMLAVAESAPPFRVATVVGRERPWAVAGNPRIVVLRDAAFSFYYPENLELLAEAGAELVFASPCEDPRLPSADAIYAGGGFPETNADKLASNRAFAKDVRDAVREGVPVYAECGGLMYLARELRWQGGKYPMVGALPLGVEVGHRPAGHGYVLARVDGANPFYRLGQRLRGHEFHYSRLSPSGQLFPTCLALERGTGVGEGRDGLVSGHVLAAYTHLHALGAKAFVRGLVRAGARYASKVREV